MRIEQPSVSVVICAYTEDRWTELREAVAAVASQRLAPVQVIVVVDHNPGLFERVRSDIAGVTAVQNHQARGLSGARNTGVATAGGKIIAFMDEDALPDPDWLERLVEPYSAPRVLGVGGAIEPLWLDRRPGWFPDEFDWVVGCTYRGMPEQPSPVRNLIGCNMSFRRELFDAIGGFRHGIGRIGATPLGGEETELCIRAARHFPGAVLLYEPRARVRHRVPAARATWSYFVSRCRSEGVSKAAIARRVGPYQSLNQESVYALRTLPLGVVRHLKRSMVEGHIQGILSSAAIVAGLAVTAGGYLASVGARREPPAEADAVSS